MLLMKINFFLAFYLADHSKYLNIYGFMYKDLILSGCSVFVVSLRECTLKLETKTLTCVYILQLVFPSTKLYSHQFIKKSLC